MTFKTILTIALAVVLVGALADTRAVAAANGPDNETEYETQAPPPTPDAADPPDSPGWRCHNCGADCLHPHGRRAYGKRGQRFHAPRGMKGHRGDFGHHGRGARRGGPGRGLAAERLLTNAAGLDLTDQQIEQLEKLAYEARLKLIDLETELEKARLEKRRQMETDDEDLAAMKKHLDSMARKRVEVQVLKLGHRIEAKKVLNEEQKKLIREKYPRLGMRL